MTAPLFQAHRANVHFAPAAEALLELVRHDAVSRPSGRLSQLLADEGVRSALQTLAVRHGVPGAILVGLAAAARRDPVLATQCASLLAQLPGARRHAMLWDLETGRLLQLLDAAGVRPVTLKGAALRASTYSDPVQRSFGDVDFLLPHSEIDPAIATLQAAGYSLGDAATVERFAQQHFHHTLTNAMGFQVELHWGLVQPDAVIRLTAERVLARSRTLDQPGGPPMRIPSPEDMVLHLVSQETEDWFSSIRRLVDVDRVLRSEGAFDWNYLRTAAAESRMRPILGFTLQLARRLFSAPIPAGFIPSLGLSRAARFHLSLLDPVHCVLTGYSRRRPSAARVIALCLSPDRRVGWRTLREIATDRYEVFGSSDIPEGTPRSRPRGMLSLAKLAALWGELYLRRGVAVVLQSRLAPGNFWRDGN